MNKNAVFSPLWRRARVPGRPIRCLYQAAHVFLVLSCLEVWLGPRAAWAQTRQSAPDQAPRNSELPIEARLGIRGSLGWVTFHGEDSDNRWEDSVLTLQQRPSFGIAAGVLSAGDFFAWRGGILLDASYMTKGSRTMADGEETGRLDLRYYDFALLALLERELGSRLRGYLIGGPGLSILRDATLVVASGDYDITFETTDRDRRWVAGVGVGWVFRPSHVFTFDVRTDIGTRTTDIRANGSDIKNLAISLSLGYQWSYPPRRGSR